MVPLFLIGYRGSGKTAVARALSKLWSCACVDADEELERRAGKSIRHIFQDAGEADFRDRESAVLADLARRHDVVVATGGGVVLRPQNRELLHRGRIVWLSAPAETLWRRMQEDVTTAARRPNLAQGGLAEVKTLLEAREPIYRDLAELVVDSSRHTPEEIAAVIDARLGPNAVCDTSLDERRPCP